MKSLIVFAFIVLIVLLIAASISAGDIKTYISDYDSLYADYLGKQPRLFIGSFQFENVPIPATPTKVHFTLEAIYKGYFSNEDWTIKLDCYENTILLSDSVFEWPGPHKIGDKFEGDIVFVPYFAGFGGISVYSSQFSSSKNNGIAFGYCFDEDGILGYLGKWELYPGTGMLPKCLKYGFRNVFYNQDSIIFVTREPGIPNWPFNHVIVIKPIPTIGKKSTMYITLKANDDLSEIGKTILGLTNVDIIDESRINKAPMKKGEDLSFSFDFIPELRQGLNSISLYQTCRVSNRNGNITIWPDSSSNIRVYFSMLFNDDGILRYCGSRNLEVPKEMISSEAYQKRPARKSFTYQF